MEKSSSPIRVVLADDHELFRDGFSVMIGKEPQIDLAGQAENGEMLLQMTEQLQPDVVITDIQMPVKDGIAVMHEMKRLHPHIGVIALTNHDEENLIVEMLEAGARGYLLKTAHKAEIVEAIKTVHLDGTYYCHSTYPKLAQLIANSSFNPYRKTKKAEFNDREKEVMRMICQGLTNKEMALKMFLSPRTIENYRENILEKIGENNTAAIVIYAIKHGIYKI